MSSLINEQISIIGVPFDLGASIRGASLGPDAMRYAGMVERLGNIGFKIEDLGNVTVHKEKAFTAPGSNLKNFNVVKEVNEDLAVKVDEVMKKGSFPLVLGGDHSIAIGTIKGVLRNVPNLGVIWFDAHGDINTHLTSPSGNMHGMPVASLLGIGNEELNSIAGDYRLKKENIVYIGCRDLDAGERKAFNELGIIVFTMHEVDKYGIVDVMEAAIEIATKGTDGIHVSFDLDGLDTTVAPGTGTKVLGGLSFREGNLALEMIAKTNKLVSAEFVEVNPLLDHENATSKVAVILAGSLLGEWLI